MATAVSSGCALAAVETLQTTEPFGAYLMVRNARPAGPRNVTPVT
jgi:hypothetical protein